LAQRQSFFFCKKTTTTTKKMNDVSSEDNNVSIPNNNNNNNNTSLHLQVQRMGTEHATQHQKIVQLEHQLGQLEQIAQEKHMEIQRIVADHEEVVAALREQLKLAHQPKSAKDSIRDGELVTAAELQGVKTDLEMQERIISVLERENAQLIQEKKTFVSRLKNLENELANTKTKQSIQGGGPVSAGHSLNVSSDNNNNAAMSLESAQRQLQELRLQLQRSQTIELELRIDLDTAKKERREAERRAAANDGTKVEVAELETRALRVQLKRQDEEHHELVQDLGRKIAWYVDHQTFNRVQEDLLKEQQETIQQLRLKLLEAESLVTKSGVARTDKDKQIRQLQKQVQDLETGMREKNPNSIAQLIRSCQPPVQHSAVFKEMQLKIQQLTAELKEHDAQSSAAMDRLRVESDKVRMQYQSRLEKLEEEMRVRVLNAQTRKVKELEKQLADSRKYYTEKLKEQEQAIVMLRRGITTTAKTHTTNTNANTAIDESATHDSEHHATSAARKSKPNQTSSRYLSHVASPHSRGPSHSIECQTEIGGDVTSAFPTQRVAVTTTHVPSTASANFTNTVIALQQENLLLKQQLEALAQSSLASVTAAPPSVAATSFHLASSLQSQIQALHNELALSRRLLTEAQEQGRLRANENEDRFIRIRAEHQRELALVREEHTEEMRRCENRCHAEVKLAMDRAEAELGGSYRGGRKGSASISSSPQHQDYLRLVTERLHILEHRQASQEMDTQREVDEIRRVAQFEIAVEKQRTELLVQQKNQEIEHFRLELDTLLRDLAQLQTVRG
jgi:hypothetical protein